MERDETCAEDAALATSTDADASQSASIPDVALLGNYMASAFAPTCAVDGGALGSDLSAASQTQQTFLAPPQHT